MAKIKIAIFSFILSYCLTGQDCNYIFMDDLREKSVQLSSINIPSKDDLLKIEKMKEMLEQILATCATINFEGKDLIEYRYLENLLEFCIKLGDIEGRIKYLVKIGEDPNRDYEEFPNIDAKVDEINSLYGPLHIRFADKNLLKDMATLKNGSGGEVTINILPPVNAWPIKQDERNLEKKKRERKEKYNRLKFIKSQSRDGNLKVYFDTYNREEDFFYFVLPYVPYLTQSRNSDRWYAITFDDKKRYRINFNRPRPDEKPDPLTIQPEEGWRLEVSTPEKWVKLSFENPEIRLKFFDRKEKPLNETEYLKIIKGNKVDYYIPSDRHIKIVYPSRGDAIWNTISKVIYGSFSLLLIFFIYTGVS